MAQFAFGGQNAPRPIRFFGVELTARSCALSFHWTEGHDAPAFSSFAACGRQPLSSQLRSLRGGDVDLRPLSSRKNRGHVRLRAGARRGSIGLAKLHGSVRLDNACSAALVGSEELVQTNHHCISDCVINLSAEGFDPYLDPMLAQTLAEELHLSWSQRGVVVTSISDVTATIAEAIAGLAGEAAADARDDASRASRADPTTRRRASIAKWSACIGAASTPLQVPALPDVRLAFAPELAALFGGDPDNFNFPRYAFDVALPARLRDGKPAETPIASQVALSGANGRGGGLRVGKSDGTGRALADEHGGVRPRHRTCRGLVTAAEFRGRCCRILGEGEEQARASGELLLRGGELARSPSRGGWQALCRPAIFRLVAGSGKRAAGGASRPRISSGGGAGGPWEAIERAFEGYPHVQLRGPLARRITNSELFGRARDIVRAR